MKRQCTPANIKMCDAIDIETTIDVVTKLFYDIIYEK